MFVKTLNIVLAEWLKIPTEGLPPQLERKLHERLVFTNPDYEMRHNRGDWIGNIPPQINCMRQKGRNYLLPRGFLDQFVDLCKKYSQPYRISDRRRSFDPMPIEFHGELKSYQQDAAEAVLEKDFSTLVGGHKSGKTVIALYTLAQRRQPTLILIPKLDILESWLSKIENFLQIPRSEVGIFAGGTQEVGQLITIAHTGEMMRYWRKIYDQIGYVILDDCQRCPSKVLTHLITNFDSRYMLGLSNSIQRKDRLSRLVYYYIGEMVYSINEKDAKEGRGIIPANVIARKTEFEFPYHSRAEYSEMLRTLSRDEARTHLIADDIEAELGEQPQPLLVLSGGEDQNETLRAELTRRGIAVIIYGAELQESEVGNDAAGLDEPLACPDIVLPDGPVAVIVNAEVLAKCFQKLSTTVLFLSTPLYFKRNLSNAIRNLTQNGMPDEVRRLKIYDYVDERVGLLENYFRMRCYNYGVHPDLLLNPAEDVNLS
ncbi:MAG: DEAD/DEAH box helicase [Syntrophobacteraceae bacterium]